MSKTVNQNPCLYWNSHLLLQETYNMFMEDAETHGIAEHNFCRYELLPPVGPILVA